MITRRINQQLQHLPLLLLALWLFAGTTSCGATLSVSEPERLLETSDRTEVVTQPTDELLHVHFIDVGQGDAIAIITPDEQVVLIDAGTSSSSSNLVSYLQNQGVSQINLAVITHAHADHIGGFQQIIDRFEVLRFADPGYAHTTAMYANLLTRIVEEEIPVYQLTAGEWMRLSDEIELVVLSPPQEGFSGTRSDVNSNSLVVLLTYREVSFLFTGDAEPDAERFMVQDGALGPVTVLKVAHHGGRHSSTVEFLNVAQPEYSVISVGASNRYGHPTPETIERLRVHSGHRIYRTDQVGSIHFQTDGRSVTVTTERGLDVSLEVHQEDSSPAASPAR